MVATLIEKGPTPPADKNRLWLDTSLWGSRVDYSPAAKFTPLAAARNNPNLANWHQEPNLYWSSTYQYWGCIWSANGGIAFGQSRDPFSSRADAWVFGATLMAGINGWGWHATCHLRNDVLYYIGGDNSGSFRLFTAPVPAYGDTPVWTSQGNILTGIVSPGNTGLCWAPDGSVVLFLERLISGQWRTGFYTAPAVTGPYTAVEAALDNLSPQDGVFGYGGPFPIVENGGISLLYHTSMGRKSVGMLARQRFPGFGAGANLSDYEVRGSILNPWIGRTHPSEVDQVADLCAAFDDNGMGIVAWAGNTNASGTGDVIMAPLRPTLKAWIAGAWHPVHAPTQNHLRREWTESQGISNGNYTLQNYEKVTFANLNANRTATLPRAALGTRVRIVCNANNGAFTVTPAVASGTNVITSAVDAFNGTAGDPISAGAARTLVCEIDGQWFAE